MASKDWLPSGNLELRTFSRLYSAQISSSPEAFNISPELAAELALRTAEYSADLDRTLDPMTASPVAFVRKRDSKRALMKCIRVTAGVVQASPFVTDSQRAALELPIWQEDAIADAADYRAAFADRGESVRAARADQRAG